MLATGDRASVLPATPRGRVLLLVVLGLALALRAGAVIVDSSFEPANDALHFDLLATSIADGDGYQPALFDLPSPSAYRAPLYPTALAAVYLVAGSHSYTAGRIANGVIGTVLVGLIGLVGAQLWGRRVGAVALALAAVHPTLILHGTSLMSEPLLATMVMAATAAALHHRRGSDGVRWALAAGALVGLAALTRETGLLLIPGIAWLVSAGPRPRRAWIPAALVVVAAVAVISPWTVRNAVRLDGFVPVSTSGGYSFAGTYNQTSMDNPRDPAIWIPPQLDPHLAEAMLATAEPTELELDRVLRREAVEFAKDHPGYLPKVLFWNTVRFFDLQGPRSALEYAPFVPYPSGLTRAGVYASWVLGLLAIGGLSWGATRRTPAAIWLFPLLAFGLHIALSANIRYRAALEPFTVLVAAFAVARLIDHMETRRRPA